MVVGATTGGSWGAMLLHGHASEHPDQLACSGWTFRWSQVGWPPPERPRASTRCPYEDAGQAQARGGPIPARLRLLLRPWARVVGMIATLVQGSNERLLGPASGLRRPF